MIFQLTWEFAYEHSLKSGPPQLHRNILVFGGFLQVSKKKTFKRQSNYEYRHQFHTLHDITFYISGRLESSHMVYMS